MARAIRNSQLRLLAECGWAYKEAYVDETPAMPSPALHRGQNVHAAIRAMVHEIVAGAPTLNVHEVAYRVVRGDAETYADAIDVLTRFNESLAEDFSIDAKGAFLFEERLDMPLEALGEPFTFYGTPDLVERVSKTRVRITDFKTHWQVESREAFLADVQLPRYALLVHEHFPAFTEFVLVKRFVRYQNNQHERVMTIDDLAAVRQNLVQQIATEEDLRRRGEFTPTPGAWCSFCSYHHTCPVIAALRERARDDLSIPDDDAARSLAGDVVAVEAFAAAAKARLKGYLAQHPRGYVPLAGGTFGYAPIRERSVDAAELRQVLAAQGIEAPDRLWNVDLDQLDRLMKRLPDDPAAAIEAVIKRGTTSRLQFRKGPPPAQPAGAGAATQEEALFS